MKPQKFQKLPADPNFFNIIDTEFKAYFLGFILADGNIHGNRLSIRLGLKDSGHLSMMSKNLFNGLDAVKYLPPSKKPKKIKGRTLKDVGCCNLAIGCKQWKISLAKYSMLPAKSLTLSFPESLEIKFFNHFIRGYFDGDGCLSKRKHSGAVRYIFSLLSSTSFCKTIQYILHTELQVKAFFHGTNSKIDKIVVTGNQQIKRIMDWLYKDATIFLERKHQIYQELLNDCQRVASKPKSSKYLGVSWDANRHLWMASYRFPNRTKYIGRFKTERQAYQARLSFCDSII